jgi:hypothetical protein
MYHSILFGTDVMEDAPVSGQALAFHGLPPNCVSYYMERAIMGLCPPGYA